MNEIFVGMVTVSISASALCFICVILDYLFRKKYFIWQYFIMKGILLFFLIPAIGIPFLYLFIKRPQEIFLKGDDFTQWTLYEANTENIFEKNWSHMTILLFIIWGIVFFIIGIRRIINDMKTIEEISILAKKEEDIETIHIKEKIQKDLHIKKNIDIYITAFISSPCITGWKETKIFLPPISFSKKEMELLLKHELYHYKKKDTIYHVLVAIFLGIHWFNPIIWMFTFKIYNLGEIDCDHFVLQGVTKEEKQLYVNLLFRIAESSNKRNDRLTSFTNENIKFMKRRVYHIMKSTNRKGRLSIVAIVLSIILAPTTTYASVLGVTAVYDHILEHTGVFYQKVEEGKEAKEFIEPENIPHVITFTIEERGGTPVFCYIAPNGISNSSIITAKKGQQMSVRIMGEETDSFKISVMLNGKVQSSKTSVDGDIRFSYTVKESGSYQIRIVNLKNKKISVSGSVIVE